ncbi:MAG: CstA-like transporter-associated (seleno)protein [Steroidobacteraceae bacterium]
MRLGQVQLALRGVRLALESAWRWLRRASGDDAYERYVAHHANGHPEEPLLTRGMFYDEAQRRKWSGISRCC